ncbi:MAG: hypothetical protein HXY30_04100 [Pseudorhodoplanes sp.]|nr:hypothetical protein [Pseudorhodoplanes sp.]
MVQQLIELCTSNAGLTWMMVASDTAIALAYFAIPLTMAVVLRHRKEDIPYPWLWTLFVAFIVACGMTHLAHVWSALSGTAYLGLHATIGVITALASVGTAVAFAYILPQIRNLPSPRQQRALLEKLVAERTREKDHLIREINHRIGNQLQVLSSVLSIESRRAETPEAQLVLKRLRDELDRMSAQHLELSHRDYLAMSDETRDDKRQIVQQDRARSSEFELARGEKA